MSAYLTMMTPMTDQECLLVALEELGFSSQKVEIHAKPTQLVGYTNDRRSQTANIVIRRKHLSSASNDLGFLASETGYRAIISDYDQARYGPSWLAELQSRYKGHAEAKEARLAAEERRRLEEERRRLVEAQRRSVLERAKKMGYQVKESSEGGVVRLVLVKRTY